MYLSLKTYFTCLCNNSVLWDISEVCKKIFSGLSVTDYILDELVIKRDAQLIFLPNHPQNWKYMYSWHFINWYSNNKVRMVNHALNSVIHELGWFARHQTIPCIILQLLLFYYLHWRRWQIRWDRSKYNLNMKYHYSLHKT